MPTPAPAPQPPHGGTPRSVADVTRANVDAMLALDRMQSERSTLTDRFADAVARACGHIAFSLAHAVAIAAWVLWNTLGPEDLRFDPYPFIFLALWASCESLFLMSFVLISQNYQSRVAERRNQLDLQINLLAEQENSKMLLLLQDIAREVGALRGRDPEVGVLVQATRPEALARQIEEAYRGDEAGDGQAAAAEAAGRAAQAAAQRQELPGRT
jgi:uncharacterized membrane protein